MKNPIWDGPEGDEHDRGPKPKTFFCIGCGQEPCTGKCQEPCEHGIPKREFCDDCFTEETCQHNFGHYENDEFESCRNCGAVGEKSGREK